MPEKFLNYFRSDGSFTSPEIAALRADRGRNTALPAATNLRDTAVDTRIPGLAGAELTRHCTGLPSFFSFLSTFDSVLAGAFFTPLLLTLVSDAAMTS